MPSRQGFKITLGSIAAAIGIITALAPYLSLKERVESNAIAIKINKEKADADHDILIKTSSDVSYIKNDISDIKKDVSDIKRAINASKMLGKFPAEIAGKRQDLE